MVPAPVHDIATEEERARISDRSNSAYPILARTLAARRDNLRDTIAALEQRLTTIKAPLVEAVAAQRPLTSIEVADPLRDPRPQVPAVDYSEVS
jgi:hypothetical protein